MKIALAIVLAVICVHSAQAAKKRNHHQNYSPKIEAPIFCKCPSGAPDGQCWSCHV